MCFAICIEFAIPQHQQVHAIMTVSILNDTNILIKCMCIFVELYGSKDQQP